MQTLNILLISILIIEGLYIIYQYIKLKSIKFQFKNSNKNLEDMDYKINNISNEKEEIERRIDEKNFKFLAINQMAKTLAKEKNVTELKKLIMDMLLEVNSVRRGISFQKVDKQILPFERKNIEKDIFFELDMESDVEIYKYLKNNKFVSIKELLKFDKTKKFAEIFEDGYVMTFLVTEESGYENIDFIVVLGEKSYGDYSTSDGDFFETLIGQIEIILENSLKNNLIEEQNAQLNEKVYDLWALYNASKMISTSLDIDVIFSNSVDMFIEISKATKGCVLYYEKESGQLIIKSLKGEYNKSIIGTSVKIDKETIEYLKKREEGIILSELRETETVIINFYLSNKEFFKNLKSEVLIPLTTNDEFIGIILLGMKYMEEGYKPAQLEVLSTLGSQIAISSYNAKLYNLAITDGMTKLYLHRYMQSRLDEEFERAKRYKKEFSFLMTDIDHFKIFNDTYGHQIGDKVLIKVADIIKKRVRKSDLAARYGGEEFAVLLPETSEEGAFNLAENIRKEIAETTLEFNGKNITITISIGVSSFNFTNNLQLSKEELIKQADLALYRSKESGRNKVTKYSNLKENI